MGEVHVQPRVGARMHTTAVASGEHDESFKEAAVTFLEARGVSATGAPLTSREPGEALRAFCEDVAAR